MIQQAHALRLPAGMRERPQWLLAGPNEKGELKVPVTVALDGRLAPGSSTDRATWLDFDYALECALERGYGLGYVLAADDPYTCVDFDVKNHHNAPNDPDKWTNEYDLGEMHKLVQELGSYTELSQSGQGVHVWCLANIGQGVKHRGIEVYGQERFIACTGKAVHDLPVRDQQDFLTRMVAAMRLASDAHRSEGLYEAEDELSDDEVMRRAWDAENATKFRQLWNGDWQSMGYPSQSEADLSLMSMLTFYSRSNEQCRRLFRNSQLGMRDKAIKDDRYLDYTLRLIRGRQSREDAAVARTEGAAQAMLTQARATAQAMQQAATAAGNVPPGFATPEPIVGPPAPAAGLDWPPGMAGALARFVYHAAPRPVKEVAIVAALGWLAGVCGKAWIIPNSGLNCYIILVARSAIGKEAMHTGLSALTKRLVQSQPTAPHYVNFDDFASGPALARACAAQTSFVNVSSEFGHKLKRMANEIATEGPMRQLRTIMTQLYQKSGPMAIVGGISYSLKDKNVGSVTGVAYSMIGETTPNTLYESLTESMMSDGFLSRFTIVEYDGERPAANLNPVFEPSDALVETCGAMITQATTLINNAQNCHVRRTGEAGMLMDAFDVECDGNINGTKDEAVRQMWNRAHLKMCRIAALLAVGDNHTTPIVNDEHVRWALDLVRRDIGIMQRRMEAGDVGTGDDSREKKLLHLLREYITEKHLAPSYKVPALMHEEGVVPRKYLQVRTAQLAAFTTHRLGSTGAMDQAIRSLVDSGYLMELDKTKISEKYAFHGRCFKVVQLP